MRRYTGADPAPDGEDTPPGGPRPRRAPPALEPGPRTRRRALPAGPSAAAQGDDAHPAHREAATGSTGPTDDGTAGTGHAAAPDGGTEPPAAADTAGTGTATGTGAGAEAGTGSGTPPEPRLEGTPEEIRARAREWARARVLAREREAGPILGARPARGRRHSVAQEPPSTTPAKRRPIAEPAPAEGGADTPVIRPLPPEHPPEVGPGNVVHPLVRFSDAGFAWAAGARAALGMGLPFALVTATLGVNTGIFAALGGYTVLYASREPYVRRAVTLACVGVGLAVSFTLGSLTAGTPWLYIPVITLVAITATFVCGALRVDRPAGYMFTLVAAMAAFLPHQPDMIAQRALLVLLGSAAAWLVSMSGWLLRPRHPEHRALADCFEALADLYADIGTGVPDAVRHQASETVQEAWTTVLHADTARNRRTGEARRLLLLCRRALDLFQIGQLLAWERKRPLPTEIPEMIRAFAGAVGKPRLVPGVPPVLAETETPIERILRAVLRDTAAAAGRPAVTERVAMPGQRATVRELLRAGFDRSSPIPPTALRTGVGVGSATMLAGLLPVIHPSWVAISAASALQGGNFTLDFTKVLQRAVGAFLGVLVVALFFQDLEPGQWLVVTTVALLFGGCQATARRNLALGIMLVTPVGLFLAAAGRPSAHVGDLAATRLLDTVIGLAAGLAASFLLWPRASAGRLPLVLGRAIRVEGMLLHGIVAGRTGGDPGWEATRRAAGRELIDLWSTYDAALGEVTGRRTGAERYWPALITTQRLGYRVMTPPERYVGRQPDPASPEDLRLLDGYIAELADAAENRRAPEPRSLPDLWGHPVLRQYLKRLRDGLESAVAPAAPRHLPEFVRRHVLAPPARLLHGARRATTADTRESVRPARNRGPGDRT